MGNYDFLELLEKKHNLSREVALKRLLVFYMGMHAAMIELWGEEAADKYEPQLSNKVWTRAGKEVNHDHAFEAFKGYFLEVEYEKAMSVLDGFADRLLGKRKESNEVDKPASE